MLFSWLTDSEMRERKEVGRRQSVRLIDVCYSTFQAIDSASCSTRRALGIDEKSYGPDHPNVARDLNNLAALNIAQQRYPEALGFIDRVLALRPGDPSAEANRLVVLRALAARGAP